jgi:hypothetical protein
MILPDMGGKSASRQRRVAGFRRAIREIDQAKAVMAPSSESRSDIISLTFTA